MKAKIFIYGFLVIVSVNISCIKQVSKKQLQINYHFTAEATYTDIEIKQSKLKYTYFDDSNKKSLNWIRQEPMWTTKDLKTKEVTLSETEINNLTELIRQTKFINLKNTYGDAKINQRFYAYKLFVKFGEKEKKVTYQSFPGASPMPEAFKKVQDKLFDLVNMEFKE